jgi:hypothetical protein
MKTFKAICAASVMALSLSVPAYAEDPLPGDIHIPGAPCPVTGGTETPTPTPSDPASSDAGTGDISLSALADMFWALTSIF